MHSLSHRSGINYFSTVSEMLEIDWIKSLAEHPEHRHFFILENDSDSTYILAREDNIFWEERIGEITLDGSISARSFSQQLHPGGNHEHLDQKSVTNVYWQEEGF